MTTSADRHDRILRGADRLAVLRKLALIDSDKEPFFDRMTTLASRMIGAPVSLVSMVTSTYQFFKSSHGLPEPWQSQRRTPLSHSFCQHVVTSGEPLVIHDAREHPLVKDNLAITDLNVIGYLGVPLQSDDGHKLGSFCVIDGEPRQWTDSDITILSMFGEIVNAEIEARASAYRDRNLKTYIEARTPQIDDLERELASLSDTDAILERLRHFRDSIPS